MTQLAEGASRPARPAAEGNEGLAVLVKARRHIAALAVLAVGVALLSLAANLWGARREYDRLALSTARTLFAQVVVTRRWNALHGGVYVPTTSVTVPNPYLEDPARDVVTTGGVRLTKLNPAYMTRLISEVLHDEQGARFHITSLRPIRPENAPDAWERAALETFERGATERFGVVGAGAGSLFRYIAPLATEESCLHCHAKQGYRAGDVRGGIGVSLPYAPYRAAFRRHARNAVGAHALLLALGLGLIAVLGRSLVARIRELRESSLHIKRLEGLLPICAGCKRIRTAGADPKVQASWEPIEGYIRDRTDADFTHGLCPECAREYLGPYAGE